MQKILCHKCSKISSFLTSFSRTSECNKCSSDLKVCLNCILFDKNSSKQCRESQSDLVREKDKANFCDWFVAYSGEKNVHGEKKERIFSDLDKLFSEDDSKKNIKNSNTLNLDSFFKK